MKHQRGFSLLSLVFTGFFVVLVLVYGKAFVVIPYTHYKVGSIMTSLIREGGMKEYELKKVFDERVQFERIADIITSKNLTITSGNSGVQIVAEYEHCAILWTNWNICAQMTAKR